MSGSVESLKDGQQQDRSVLVARAKHSLRQPGPGEADLPSGKLFQNEGYFDSMPHEAHTLICAAQSVGEHPDRPCIYYGAGLTHLRRATSHSNSHELMMAGPLLVAAVKYTLSEDERRLDRLHACGRCFQQVWHSGKDASALRLSLHFYRKAAQVAELRGALALPAYLTDVAFMLVQRYDALKSGDDEQEAGSLFRRASELSQGHHTHAIMLSNEADFLRSTAEAMGSQRTIFLGRSIVAHEKAVAALSPAIEAQRGQIYRNAAVAYAAMFNVTSQLSVSAQALEAWTQALKSVDDVDPRHLKWRVERMDQTIQRFIVSQDDSDIRSALQQANQVLSSPHSSAAAMACKAFCLQKMLAGQQCAVGAIPQLEEAAELVASAIADKQAPAELRAKWYHWSSGIQLAFFEQTGGVSALETAVDHAVKAAELDTADVWNHHRTAAEMLDALYMYTHDPKHLEQALHHSERALDIVPPWQDQNIGLCYWTNGKILSRSLVRRPGPDIFKQSVEALRGAMILEGHSDKALVLNDIGNVHATQFGIDHDHNTAEAASTAYMKALDLLEELNTPATWQDTRMIHAGLGYLMLRRFLVWGSLSDLDASTKHYEFSIKDMGDQAARSAPRICNLAHTLQLRFTYDGDSRNLIASQELLNRLLKTPLESTLPAATRVLALMHQGSGHQYMATAVESLPQICQAVELAVEMFETVLELAAEIGDETTMRQAASNLAVSKATKARATGSEIDIQDTFEAFETGEAIIGSGHPDVWTLRSNWAGFLIWTHEEEHCSESALKAMELLEDVLRFAIVTASRRILSLSALAKLYVDRSRDYTAGASCLQQCAELLPQAILSHSNRLEQLHFIRQFAFLPSSAAALYAAAGRSPRECVAILERTRGFLSRRLIAATTEVDALRTEHPEEFETFQAARRRVTMLEKPSHASVGTSQSRALASADMRLMDLQASNRALEMITIRIRGLRGYETFLQPIDPLEIESAVLQSVELPIVWVNLSRYRCDAFIAFGTATKRIPLDTVAMKDVETHASRILHAQDELMNNKLAEAESMFEQAMRWLWYTIAKPVLAALQQTRPVESETSNRIFWVASGWLSILPIHAAGDFQGNPQENLQASAVSSYITTLEALAHMRRRLPLVRQLCSKNRPQALLVGMNTTASLSSLEARQELSTVRQAVPMLEIEELQDQEATYAAVTKGLQSSDIAHFACHGKANSTDPSLSSLVLADYSTKPLHIRSIMRMQIEHCGLCFLSACETGVSKDLALRDESVHIAGALQMAGVMNVIASMWSVADDVCLALTRTFYTELVRRSALEQAEGLSLAVIPFAFHAAIQEIRDSGVSPLLWGAWFHSGV